jgi:hypothetical protein
VSDAGTTQALDPIKSTFSLNTAALDLLKAVSLVTALCYGCGWIFYTALYSKVGMQPEGAGITAESVLVRSVLIGAVVVFPLGGLLMPTAWFGWWPRGRQGDLGPFHTLVVVSGVLGAGLAAWATYHVILRLAELGRLLTLGASLAVGVLFLLVTLPLLLRGVRYRAISTIGPRLGPMVRSRHLIALGLMWVVLLFGSSAAAGSVVGQRTYRGQETTLFVLDIQVVEATSRGSSTAGSSTTTVICGLRLGEANGALRLWDAQQERLMSIPLASVSVAAGKGVAC